MYEEQFTVSLISFWFYFPINRVQRVCEVSTEITTVEIGSVEHCNFSYPRFLGLPVFRTNFRSSLRFEKSPHGFSCNFGMIIRSLDVWIGSVFVFTAILVSLYNTCFQALCNFFRAIRSPLPQVQRCPYAYVHPQLKFPLPAPEFTGVSSGVEGEYFNLRSWFRIPLFSGGEYSYCLIIFRRIFLIILVFKCWVDVKFYLIFERMIIHFIDVL